MADFTIDPEFEALCPPLDKEELMHLRADIVRFGCREALVVWATESILVDGHNRFRVCTEEGVPYRVHRMEFTDRRHARGWIITNQLGRRNLTAEQKSYLRGMRFLTEKRPEGRPKKLSQNATVSAGPTADRLAEHEKVHRATVHRDAEYASAVQAMEQQHGPEARVALLQREAGRITKKDALRLVDEPPHVQKAVLTDKAARREWKKAPEPISGAEATERQVAAVMAAWNRCGPEAREIVLSRISAPAVALRIVGEGG